MRLLRPTGVAIGLFAALFSASCLSDASLQPTGLRRVDGNGSVQSTVPLVITEIMPNPAAPNDVGEYIEIFNAGTTPIDLNGMVLRSVTAAQNPESRTINLPVAVNPGSCVILANTAAIPGVTVAFNYGNLPLGNNALDLIFLTTTDGAVIDSVGYGGFSVGASVNGFSFYLDVPPTVAITTIDNHNLNQRPPWKIATAADVAFGVNNAERGTPGVCNYLGGGQQIEVDHVTVTPSTGTVIEGATQEFTARAFDDADQPVDVSITWSSSAPGVATVVGSVVAGVATGVATGVGPGDAEIRATAGGVTGFATLHVDEGPLPNLPAVRFSEIHYDNINVDVGEAIEVEGPAGTDLTGWSVVLYNGNGGGVYDTRALTQTLADQCGGRGVVVLLYEQDGVQNGSPDGFALVDAGGQVVEFLSYEGPMTAINGPAQGMTSTDIGVAQAGAAHFQTLQRRPSGRWEGPKASTLGGCYGTTPVTPHNQISFSGRLAFDAPLPVGFEDQLFADLRAPNDAENSSQITWSALTPAVATIDARGVMHALAAGTASFRATASDGTTATYSLPMHVATASTTAQYGNHTEFGVPTDSDASDDFIISRPQLTLSFNRNTNIPNWVSYNLEATHIQSGQDRCDCFTYDPMLPADFRRYNTADYTGAGAFAGDGIDRGHLARSFDRTAGSLDNAVTYYFSNIIPQFADNNQGPWARMENFVGSLATGRNKEVYVVAGASGNKGTVKDEGLITIPEYVWKVVVSMPRDQGLGSVDSYDDVEVLAVIMPNIPGIRGNPNNPDDWRQYITTVNAVEALSGYDVLSLLPKKVEAVVEAGMQDEMALLDQLVADGKINKGNGNSLQSKLEAAASSIERGDNAAAVNQLETFLHEVDAMDSKRLAPADANVLRAAINALIASVSS